MYGWKYWGCYAAEKNLTQSRVLKRWAYSKVNQSDVIKDQMARVWLEILVFFNLQNDKVQHRIILNIFNATGSILCYFCDSSVIYHLTFSYSISPINPK